MVQIAITEFAYPCQNFAKVIDLQLTIVSRAQAVVYRRYLPYHQGASMARFLSPTRRCSFHITILLIF